MEKPKSNPTKGPKDAKAAAPPSIPAAPAAPVKVAPMFRRLDWLTMALTFGVIWIIYLFTLAPEQTLEDSGELCTGAFYAGIPHPPGYPFWSVYAWFWTAILPIGNVAWRVEVGESFAAAMGCGLLALMVSRGSSLLIEGIEVIKGLPRRWENAICSVSGFVAGTLLGLDVFMWSESVVINRISVFGVPWLLAVMACLMRWMYAPQQRRYLYLAMFLYGLCATIHQSLLLGAMGIETIIVLASPRLGRDVLVTNSLLYVVMLLAKSSVPALSNMTPIEFFLFHAVGLSSIAVGGWLVYTTSKIATEWKTVLLMGVVWVLGVLVYLYEPVSGMTDPPMQWGYPRTVEGFFHALSRGQYESVTGSDPFKDPSLFAFQLTYLVQGLSESFSWVFVFVGALPFLFLHKMQRRERAWIIGVAATYVCISVLLVVLLNVQSDRSSSDLNKVFFTASHALFALMIGYGLTLLAAYTATHYQKVRFWGMLGALVGVVLAIICLKEETGKLYRGPAGVVSLSELPHYVALAFTDKDQYGLPVFANLILLAIPACLIVAFLVYRQRGPVLIMLCLFAIVPTWSGLSHWYKSEQHNHWFGFWFGHDMFTPPFTDPKTGKTSYDNDLRARLLKDPANATRVYPEMDRNTIIFGGTDPGRFCPTYSIFCDSFIPHSCQPAQDQKFDRRDCYLITQNALADGTYLDYLRAQYNRSQQIDPPFFSELSKYIFGLFLGEANADTGLTGAINSMLFNVLDRPFTAWGAHVEKYRRAEGVYPPNEIYIPSPDDSQKSFSDYSEDAARRKQAGQLQPGEVVNFDNGRVLVSGQVSVMKINGLLCRVIFDHNPTNSFYVEESFPLDWMYPYESPFGIIMKINRNPLPELSPDVFALDHTFWTNFSTRLCGNWITYDTTVQQIADFVDRTYIHNNYKGYTGDHAFVRDDDAQKAFSKLRSSQAGMYAWRCSLPGSTPPLCPPEYRQKTPESQAALLKETDFAFKQSFAFCPYSPEAVYRYVQFLIGMAQTEVVTHPDQAARHFDDAILVGETCEKLDPYNQSIADLVKQVKGFKSSYGERSQAFSQMASQVEAMETIARTNPANVQNLVVLGTMYMQMQQTSRAVEVFDKALASPELGFADAVNIAQYYEQIGNTARHEAALKKMISLAPNPLNAQSRVVLGGAYLQLGQTNQAIELFDAAVASPDITFQETATIAQHYAQLGAYGKLETVIEKLVSLAPDQPEPRFDLAALQAIMGQQAECFKNLTIALDMSAKRLAKDPTAHDLQDAARTDGRFDRIRSLPEFQKLVPPK